MLSIILLFLTIQKFVCTGSYSFDYGSVHIVMIDTEHNLTENSEQYRFLDSDLSSVDRKTTPWFIVGGHRTMYVDSETDEISGNPPVFHHAMSTLGACATYDYQIF